MNNNITNTYCVLETYLYHVHFVLKYFQQFYTPYLAAVHEATLNNSPMLTSLAVQFYLGFCSKSGTLVAWLASCQCLCLSSLAVG